MNIVIFCVWIGRNQEEKVDNYVPEVTVRGAAIILIFFLGVQRERERIVLYRTVTGGRRWSIV